jgi:hypothetical protein
MYESDPADCGRGTDRPCPVPWIDAAVAAVVVAQVVVVLVMPVVATVTRRLVLGLMAAPAPFTFYIEHVWLRRLYYGFAAWTWVTTALDQRARRRQRDALPLGEQGSLPPSPCWRFNRRSFTVSHRQGGRGHKDGDQSPRTVRRGQGHPSHAPAALTEHVPSITRAT